MLDTKGADGNLKVSKAVMTLPKGSSNAVVHGKTIVAGTVAKSQLTVQSFTLAGKPVKVLWRQKVAGPLTDIDPAVPGGTIMVTAGDLYVLGSPAVPAKDLADATW
jgi:hypothetical protein